MHRWIAGTMFLLFLSGCSFFTDGWRGAEQPKPPKPDVVLRLVDGWTGWEITDARITPVVGDSVTGDTVFPLDWGLEYGIARLPMGNVTIEIAHDEYLPAETTIAVQPGKKKILELVLTSRLIATGQPDRDTGSYKSGWDAADADLIAKNACRFRSGGLLGQGPNFIDTESGLPVRGNFTCIVDDRVMGYSEGYNDRVQLYINRSGLPANSKKQWLPIILEPKKYFKSESRKARSILMPLDGTEVDAPFDSLAIAMRAAPDTAVYTVEVTVVNRRTGEAHSNYVRDSKRMSDVRLVWGPEGSELVILKSASHYHVIGLRQCEVLHYTW